MDKYVNRLKTLLQKGLFHIMGTNILNYLISFVTNILIVRFLSKTNYGIFSYAYNQYSLFLLFSGMGLISGVLQFGSEKRPDEEKESYFRFGLTAGLIFNLLISTFIFLYGRFVNISIPESAPYICELMLLPLFDYVFNYIAILLRIRKKNKEYARLMNINTILYFLFACSGAYFYGITGTILGRYFAFSLSIIIGIRFCKYDFQKMRGVQKLYSSQKRGILKYSIIACLSNSISSLLYLIDIALIGLYIKDSVTVAVYKVATTIPNAMVFIPSSIMVFIYPYFAEQNQNFDWIKQKYYSMLKALLLVNAFISLLLVIFAPYIISILWGQEYLDAVIPFRILSFSYFISASFRIPCGNILAMLRKVKVNLVVSIISGICNILLDMVLIPYMGSNGAAVATLSVVAISSVIAFPYLLYYINSNISDSRKV
jgi:O-antigen/teichoic acid export membrane protein